MADRHPEVREEIVAIERTLEVMLNDLALTPPTYVRDRIEARIADPKVPAARVAEKTKKIHYWQYGVAATFTLKLIFMAVAAYFWMNWQRTESRLSSLQERYTRLEQNTQQMNQALVAVSDPAFQPLVLRRPASDARVLTYWNSETQMVYVNTASLPPNERDEQYQLWGRVGEAIVSLGTFEAADGDRGPLLKEFQGKAGLSALMISREPQGGSATPSPGQVYQGNIP